jgi:hypothetical protein
LRIESEEFSMIEDPRCCGSGTCIIDPEGRCWCGQQWDGQKMCHSPLVKAAAPSGADASEPPLAPTGGHS